MVSEEQISVSPHVEKISSFKGSLPERNLYIYLPPGYEDEINRRYPVILLQDGQNCFDQFAGDSYTGSTWQVDQTADRLIKEKAIAPCILVGIGHGESQRIIEYLPPYSTFKQNIPLPQTGGRKRYKHVWVKGEAQKTADYYQTEILPFLSERYRILLDRQSMATCGSSMGGLFSMYLAWDHTHFAKHHAALSASFWITETANGTLEIANRIKKGEKRDIRVWLDSGTEDRPGYGDDNSPGVIEVRDALRQNGYQSESEVAYFLDEGAIHSENSWAGRFPQVLKF